MCIRGVSESSRLFSEPQNGTTKFKACIHAPGKYPDFTVIYATNLLVNICGEFGAQGESRTHTPVKAGDFESPASTIPPLGHCVGD